VAIDTVFDFKGFHLDADELSQWQKSIQTMNKPTTTEVTCADQVIAIYKRGMITNIIVAILVCSIFQFAGSTFNMPWLNVIPIILIVAGIILPLVLRVHRAFTSIPCPVCSIPVGGYNSKSSRVILNCRHCGHEALTDCKFTYSGGPPSKL
jgi:hypothetical protein